MENIARVVNILMQQSKRHIVTSREVQAAVKILYLSSSELVSEGTRLVTSYNASCVGGTQSGLISQVDMETIRSVRQILKDELKKYDTQYKCGICTAVYLFGVLKKFSEGYTDTTNSEPPEDDIIRIAEHVSEYSRRGVIHQIDLISACKIKYPDIEFKQYTGERNVGAPSLYTLKDHVRTIIQKYTPDWQRSLDKAALKYWQFLILQFKTMSNISNTQTGASK